MVTHQQLNYRGTRINRVHFSDIEYSMEVKGIDTNRAFTLMADQHEVIYVSDGFLRALSSEEVEEGEWHHYFKKDNDGYFQAFKFSFSC